MTLFYSLLLAHLVADFFQPASLVKWTKQSIIGLFTHTAGYAVLTAIVLVGYGPIWWLWLIALFLSHFSIDHIKYRIKASGRLGLVVFVVDQISHIVVITAVASLAGTFSGPVFNIISRYSNALPYLVAYIAISFAGSIFVFESGRIFVSNEAGSNEVIITWGNRLPGMIERSLALTLVLVKLYFLAPLAFLPSIGIMIRRWPSLDSGHDNPMARGKILTEFAASLLVTLIVSLLAVFFL